MSYLGQKLVRSAGWSIAGDVLVVLAGAASAVVAARLVSKAEIGLIATVFLLIGLVETVTASGVEQALVQRSRNSEELFDTAWTWQLLRGVAIAISILVAAPFVADFYGDPSLSWLTGALALQPLLRGASNIRTVLRIRELEFRTVFILNAGPALAGLVLTVILCATLHDAWALVLATLAEHALRTALSFVLLPTRPAFRIRWREIKSLLGYGRWLTGLSILVYLNTRGDDLFVSKRFGAESLAVYQLAFGIANVPVTGISRVIGRVAFPTFARLHDEPLRLRLAFTEVFRITAFAALMATVIMYFLLPYLPAVVGEKWAATVGIGRILALGGAVRALMNTGGPLFQGVGRPDIDFVMNVPRLVVLVMLLPPLAFWFGLDGVSWASFGSVCALAPWWWRGVRAQTGISAKELVVALSGPFGASVLTALVFTAVGSILPANLLGLALLSTFGVGASYASLRAFQLFTGVSLLPSLDRLKTL